jgi:hypothetical protein
LSEIDPRRHPAAVDVRYIKHTRGRDKTPAADVRHSELVSQQPVVRF